MSSRLVRLTLWLFLAFSAQSVCGSWQYTHGQADTTESGFTYQATVTENPANTFTGTAVLTAFSDSSPSTPSSVPIPPSVPIQITVNTTNSEGQPIQYNETVNCTVPGFSGFTLNSNTEWAGDVNIIGNFALNGHALTIHGNFTQNSNVTLQDGVLTLDSHYHHRSGYLSLGGGDLFIPGDYIQGADSDGNSVTDGYCSGSLSMGDGDYTGLR